MSQYLKSYLNCVRAGLWTKDRVNSRRLQTQESRTTHKTGRLRFALARRGFPVFVGVGPARLRGIPIAPFPLREVVRVPRVVRVWRRDCVTLGFEKVLLPLDHGPGNIRGVGMAAGPYAGPLPQALKTTFIHISRHQEIRPLLDYRVWIARGHFIRRNSRRIWN